MKQMRRAVSIALVLTMILSMFSINFITANAADTTAPLLGDVDGDNNITVFDASAIQKSVSHMAGAVNYDAMEQAGQTDRIEFKIADVDGDGHVTIFDASLIQKYVAGDKVTLEKYPGIGKPITTPEPPTDAPTEPVTDQPTEEQTDAPTEFGEIVDGYYIIGIIGGVENWDSVDADNLLAENPGAPGEYMLDKTFEDGDAIKVVKVENGEITAWFKDGMDNEYKLTAEGGKTGDCTVYFNPEGNPTWSYTYITVQPKSEPTPTTGGDVTDGYYIIGIIGGVKNWDSVDAANKLEANPGADGEYMLDKTFEDGDAIKVVKVENGEITAWYKDGMDNEYKLTAEGGKTGDCTVYFNPNGNSSWSYTYITVQPKTTPTGPQPTSDGEITDGYYIIGIIGGVKNWDSVDPANKLAANPGADGEYMLDKTFKDGDAIKVVKVENGAIKTWYKDGMDNEYKLTAEGGKTGDCTVYFNPNGNATWSYTYITVQPKTTPTTSDDTTATTAPTSSSDITDGYYIIGIIGGVKNWDSVDAANKLAANPGADGEYMLDKNFKDGDAIKVVKVENGKLTAWYKDGMDNEYKLTAEGGKTGDCTVYFNPNGNSSWSYTYITVQPKTTPTTSDDTTATTAPTSSSDITDGYYIIGIIGGVENWETVDAANKLVANPGAEGEYMLDKTFKNNDAIKVVKVENGKITAWYKDGLDNEYVLTDEGNKTGDCTVYFNPNGNSSWSYTYITVQPKTTPTTGGETTATAAPTSSTDITDGYYVIGNYNNWDVTKLTTADKLAANPGADGEYMLDKTFKDGDAIKVVKVENGKATAWYKDGMDNEYKLTAEGGKTGDCTVYFNPNGNSSWSYTYITVQPKTTPTTSDDTTATTATSAPTSSSDITDGYYIIGIIGGVENWETVDAANKLAANPGAEGEYMLDKTFKNNDAIKVVKVEGGKITAWYKDGLDNEYVLTDEGKKTGDCTVYFNPNGNSSWSYTYLTVQQKSSDETTAPTTSDDTTATSAPTSSTDITDGYYVIGNYNNWDVTKLTTADKLAANPGAEGEYMLDKTFKDGDAIKVVKVENGKATAWYKDGMDNEYVLTDEGKKTGDCTVYFNPNGNSSWSYTYLTVQQKSSDETTAPTTSDDTTATTAPTSSSDITDGYYIIGIIGGVENWETVDAANKLAANPGAEGEYMLDKTFKNNDAIKVVKVENGKITAWYKDGLDNEYVLTDEGKKTGDCTVYFNPNGNSSWSYTYLTVQQKSSDETTAPTTSDDTTATTASEEPTTVPETTDDTVNVYFSNNRNWDDVYVYYYISQSTSGMIPTKVNYPGTKMTQVGVNDFEEKIYTAEVPAKAKLIIFNNGKDGNDNQTVDITTFSDGKGFYTTTQDTDGKWKVDGYDYTTPSTDATTAPTTSDDTTATTAPETAAPTSAEEITDGYYLVGIINGVTTWEAKAENKLAANPGAEGEYMIDKFFKNNDAVKVAKVENGKITTWYKDGMDNEYVLTDEGKKTGNCTVYFNPNGNSSWSYTYLTVQPKSSDETTAPTTSDDTTATTAPETAAPTSAEEITDGYYLVGIINGVTTWEAKAENKLSENPGAEGEYMIDKFFKNNDAVKVAKVENGKITTWYKDGMDNEYVLTDEGKKTGNCTVYFNPNGNSSWSYTYLTVQPKSSDETTAPTTGGETSAPTTAPVTDAPADKVVLTLKAGVWEADSAWFAAYFFSGNGDPKWVKMTGASGTYTVDAADGYKKVIFVRMDKDKSALEWGSKWNQTNDLDVPTVSSTYTITGWGDGTDVCPGTWSVTPTTAPVTEAPTAAPTEAPTEAPTAAPTEAPTAAPETEEATEIHEYTVTMTVASKFTTFEFQVFYDTDVYEFVEASYPAFYTYNEDDEEYVTIGSFVGHDKSDPNQPIDCIMANASNGTNIYNFTKGKVIVDLKLSCAAGANATIPAMRIIRLADEDIVKNDQGQSMAFSYSYSFDGEVKGTGSFDGGVIAKPEYFVVNPDNLTLPPYRETPTETPTEAPVTEAPTAAPTAAPTEAPTEAPAAKYYIVGSMNDWQIDDAYKLTKNDAAESDEYVFEGLALAATDQFKVVEVIGDTKVWYPDGMGNNYGENGEITAAGTYDIYFRPNGDGGDDWFYSVIYVAAKVIPTDAPTEAPTAAPTEAPTAAPTEAPTAAPTQAPTEAPKNYVYLNPNIWNTDSPRYELYVWGGNDGAKWLTATKISDSSYRFEVPDGYTSGIFVRENPAKAAGSWDAKWNQTEDLTLTGNIGKTYKVTSWGTPAGSWS